MPTCANRTTLRLFVYSTEYVLQVDSEGRTAMIAACYMGHMDCVRELIIWGADIEVTDQVHVLYIFVPMYRYLLCAHVYCTKNK